MEKKYGGDEFDVEFDHELEMFLCGSELRRIIWTIDKTGSDPCIGKN